MMAADDATEEIVAERVSAAGLAVVDLVAEDEKVVAAVVVVEDSR